MQQSHGPWSAGHSTSGGPEAEGARPEPRSHSECRDCGGRMVSGQLVLPLLGAPKFGVKLATMSVESDISSAMCVDCGHLELWVTDTAKIRWAQEAGERAQTAMQHRKRP